MFWDFLAFILGKITFFTGSILGTGSFPKPLSSEEELECLTRMKQGDRSARDKLINHNMRLVAHVVKKYSGSADTDDLISVGSIGLIKAVDTYEMNKGTQLATYTARCIENEILMLLRLNKKHKNDVYLSDTVGTDKDGNELSLIDLLSEKEDTVFAQVDKSIEREKFLEFIKGVLNEREYTVLCLRYGLKGKRNYAQREVAKFLKISRSYISRIEKKAIDKLKEVVKKGQFYN
ncbi:MAG: sigma-70 family RNA polymerase sigma factor [Clostridiales bacterium]|nr:sigma-70 family RNA polymerase sigma factor [Clostridiales bacterium]